jgi:hypothetical protein
MPALTAGMIGQAGGARAVATQARTPKPHPASHEVPGRNARLASASHGHPDRIADSLTALPIRHLVNARRVHAYESAAARQGTPPSPSGFFSTSRAS